MIEYVKFKDYARYFMFSCSYAENCDKHRNGELSDKDWKHFKFYWHWSQERFSSDIQDKFYLKHGREMYLRRIQRVNDFYNKHINEYKMKMVNKPVFSSKFVEIFPDIAKNAVDEFNQRELECRV